MSAPRLSEDAKSKIVAAYVAGVKIEAIAAEYGVARSYPRTLAGRRGIERRQPRVSRSMLDAAKQGVGA